MRRQHKMKRVAPLATFLMTFTLLFPIMVPVALAQATTGSLRGGSDRSYRRRHS